MEIKIKKIGIAQGTVGFLAAGLTDGTLTLVESTMKSNGNHALWLKGGGVSQFLAAFNQYSLSKMDGDFQHYAPCDSTMDRQYWWTDAAWETLRSIARQWCDECNAALEAEEPVKISIVRVQGD